MTRKLYLYFTFALLAGLIGKAEAALITRTYTYTGGNTITANENNTNENTLYNEINGNLNNANILDGGISTADLADSLITTAKMASAVAVASMTITTGSVINQIGTTTNDSAAPGNIGEFKRVSSGGVAVNAASSGTWSDVASIAITAGDWDVSGLWLLEFNGATSVTMQVCISTTTGDSTAGCVSGDNKINTQAISGLLTMPVMISDWRLSVDASKTVYLKQMWSYTSGTPRTADYRLSARRRR